MEKGLIVEKVRPVLRRAGVRRAALFGSMARGDHRPDSDIDLLVELDAQVSLLGFVGLKQRLEDASGRRVDLVEYQTIKPALRAGILGQQEIIFEQ